MPQPILKDEMGKLLLSLLVARKDSCTLHDLEKDYRENEGRRIPFMDYGSLSLLDFLRSIPQYVNVFCQHGVYYVSPVVTEKIKHVSELVSKQRPGKKGTPIRRRTSRPSRYFAQVREPKPFIPNTLQNKIAEILTANPSGVNKDQIIQCLQGSSAIPTPVDSNNIDDYVRAMSSVAHSSNTRIYPNKSLHLTNMSEQQDVPSTSTNVIPPLMDSTYVRPNIQGAAAAYPAGYEDENDIYSEDDFDESPVGIGNEYRASNNDQSQQYVIDDHKTKISSAEFIKRAGQQQNHSQINTVRNNNTKNYCDNTEFEGHSDANDESAYHDSDASQISDDEFPRYIINPRIKTRLQQLIQKHPEGIWCADLLQKYLEEYKVELDYTDLGFSSVSEFASTLNLQDIFHCVRYKRLGDFKLYDATKSVPERLVGPETDPNSSDWEERVVDDIETDPFYMALASAIPSRLIPKEVLNYGESVGQEKIPDFLDATEYLEVIAAEVFSPSLFWIHLRKKKPKLDQLMDSLNNFYKHEADRYTIPHVILEKGLNCACQYDNLWHRAIIKTVKPDGDVTLIFYDFGTVKTFPPEAVRFLHRDFSNLPAQAIPCGLYNVKPLNADAWTRGVSSEFWNRIYEIPLIAIIAKIDTQTNSMLVSLVDTQEEEDLHINDWMVQMKFAEFGSMVRSRPSNFVYRHYLVYVKYRYNERKKRNRSLKSARLNSVASAANLNPSISEHGAQAKIETKSTEDVRAIFAEHSKYAKKNIKVASSSAFEKVLTNCEVPSTLVPMMARGCSSIDIPAPQSSSSSRISQLKQIIESQKSLGDPEKCVKDMGIKSQVQSEPIYTEGENVKRSQVESVTADTYPPQHSTKSLDNSNSEDHSEIENNTPTKSLDSSDSKNCSKIQNDDTCTKSPSIENSENTSGIRINTSVKQGDGVAFESSYLEDRADQTKAAPVIPDNTTIVNPRNTDAGTDATAVSENIPLVSPQSTFQESSQTTVRPPPGFTTPPTQNYYASFMDACSTQKADGSIGMASSSFMNLNNSNVNNNPSTSVDQCQSLNSAQDMMLQYWKQRLELDIQMVAAAERYFLLDRNSHTPNTVSNDPSTISPSTTTSPIFDTAGKNPFDQDSGKQEPESVNEHKHSNSENSSYFATMDGETLRFSKMAKFSESNEPEFGFHKPPVTQQNCQDLSFNPLETNFTDTPVTNWSDYKNEDSISMQELDRKSDYSTFNNGNNIFSVSQKDKMTKKPFEFNSDREDINANLSKVVNNERSAENQSLETNPFKQYLNKSIQNTENNDKPPIPPRNPNLMDENLNINIDIKKLEALPVNTNQEGNPTPRIYYAADPVMYKSEAHETSRKSSKLDREPPGSNHSISGQGKRQHDTSATPHFTNHPSDNNPVFVFGRNHSPRQNTFSPNVNLLIGSVQNGDTSNPSTKLSTDSLQCTNSKIFPNTPSPIPQSHVAKNSTEFRSKSDPISPRFTAPLSSELSKASIDAVQSASEINFYDDLEFATLKTKVLSTHDAEPNLSTNNEQSAFAMVENDTMFGTTLESTPHFQSPMPLHNPVRMDPRPQTFQHVQQSNTNVKQGSSNQRTIVNQMEETSRPDEKNNPNGIQSIENALKWVTDHQKIFETDTDRHATAQFNENYDFWKKKNDCGPTPNAFIQEPLLDGLHTLKKIDDNYRISSHNGTMTNNYSQGYFNNINHSRNIAHNKRPPPYQSQLHNIAQHYPPINPQSNFQYMSTNPQYIQHPYPNQKMPFPRPYSPSCYFPQPPPNCPSFLFSKPRPLYPYPNVPYPFLQNQPPWCLNNPQNFASNQTTNTQTSIPNLKPNSQIQYSNSNESSGQTLETSDLMKDHRISRSSFGQVDTTELQTASITDNKITLQNEIKSYTGGSSGPTQQLLLENKYTSPPTQNLLEKPVSGTPNVYKQIDVNGVTMYLFNIAKEGWVCTDELVKLFTIHDNRQVVLRILNQLDLKINFNEITRAQSPDLFSQLDSTSLRVTRMANSNKIKGTLHLTPLKSVIRLMRILEVISAEELSLLSQKRRIAPGSRLLELVRLVAAYKPDDDYWMS